MDIFVKKKKLVDAIDAYADEANKTIEFYTAALQAFFESKPPEELKELVKKVRKTESLCDEYRRQIEHHLFAGALMPGSRGDIFMLLESMDKVPNKAEQVANFVLLISPQVPEEYNEEFLEILKLTDRCTATLTSAMKKLFKNLKKATAEAKEVEAMESAIDKIERKLTWKIFHSDVELAQKLLLREMLTGMCAISDRAEDASDRIEIMAVKRKS
jgi:uncharacterized protein